MLGEIIEHVDDPVGLLRFARRHLNPAGRVLVTTPNPFYFAWPYESWREGVFVPNAEHVRWVSPAMVLEIGRRAGLSLDSWWCLHSDPTTLRFNLAAVMRIARWIPRLKEIVAGSYIYELTTAGS
jgi:2-polyprenyl-3-methyl-5-hydroxy-6-metoxy-1,4-benzoquinol methylase